MVPTTSFQRARSHEAKRHRERAILEAARRLALEQGVRAVTLTDIATAVGLHKSTMLRYFETREQIFLRLTTESWHEWADALESQLDPVLLTAHDQDWRIGRIAQVMAQTLRQRPLFCDLLVQAPLNLERNVSLESVRRAKRSMLVDIETVSALLRALLPLNEDQALNTIATATSMAGSLWQMAALGTPLRDLYESDPELRCAVIDVEAQLTDIVAGLLTGYTADPPANTPLDERQP